jgi:hypothetical protein
MSDQFPKPVYPRPRGPLTAEEARTVPLSWRPLKRLGQLAEYGSAYPVKKMASTFPSFPAFMTRGDLVRMARASEPYFEQLKALQVAQERSDAETDFLIKEN